ADRMRTLGDHLCELGAFPPAEFFAVLRPALMARRNAQLQRLADRLREFGGHPEAWARDVELFVRTARDAMTKPEFGVPIDLIATTSLERARALAPRIVGRFGELLRVWPELYRAAEELRRREPAFAPP